MQELIDNVTPSSFWNWCSCWYDGLGPGKWEDLFAPVCRMHDVMDSLTDAEATGAVVRLYGMTWTWEMCGGRLTREEQDQWLRDSIRAISYSPMLTKKEAALVRLHSRLMYIGLRSLGLVWRKIF